jgi:hypothetical protein
MARIKVLSRGVSEVLRSPQMQRFLYDALGPAEAQAKATAPRKSGAHAASIHRESGVSGDRAFAAIVASTDHSLAVEARTGHMARSLDAVRG